MGKLRESRNKSKETALIDRVPRIEIELAGLASDLSELEQYVDEQVEEVSGTVGLLNNSIYTNNQIISSNITIPATKNAMMIGIVTIADNAIVTVETGARFVII